MFNELNGNTRVLKDGINTDTMDFVPLKDFCGLEVLVDGYFFTMGRYGKQVVVVGAGSLINMPARAMETFEKIDSNEDMKKAILEGHLKLTGIKIGNTRNGTTTFYTLSDC